MLDRDNAAQNYEKGVKALQTQSGGNTPAAIARVEALLQERDQAVTTMEQCKVGKHAYFFLNQCLCCKYPITYAIV